ncbi:MAG: AraC family transcriptional regulator [Rhodospirillum sp.]|nr:AraC family transcriptional regulator [Rhodospirillum sp.]
MDGYQQIRPIEAFRALVDAYWINRPGAAGAEESVLPDGCIDLIFHGGAEGGRLFASALIERPVPIESMSGWFVGVRFRPAMARAILDVDPAECRDRNVPANMIDAAFGALEEHLLDCGSPDEAFAILKRAVDARLAQREGAGTPMRVREAIASLARGGDVHRAAHAVGMSERNLHRDLVRWCGLAPKSLARILRMQRCLAALRAGQAPLALLALRLGYADQAHMTRELKALAGVTPREVVPAVRNLQDAA